MEKKLNEFSVGEEGIVINVEGEGKIKRRLFDMGVTSGAHVLMQKKAPLGDPIQILIRGYELTLRKNEAVYVMMKVTKEAPHK